MPRLKVFRAQMGFFDSVIAAPSRKAALEAWGTRQDLFHEGLAAVTQDPAAVKAALGRPGAVLKRAAGSADPYREKAPPPAPPARSPRGPPSRRARPTSQPPRPAPDRSVLTAAEESLRAAEREHAAEAAALAKRRKALERELRDLEERSGRAEEAYADRRPALQAEVDKARRAFRRAGGR